MLVPILAVLLAGWLLARPAPRALLVDGLARACLALQQRYGAAAPRPLVHHGRTELFEPVLGERLLSEPLVREAAAATRREAARPRSPRPAPAVEAETVTVAEPPPPPSMALTVIGRPGGLSHPLAPRNVLGRGAAASIRIDDPDVSRRHVQLTVVGELVELMDLESINGTFVNGARCDEAMLAPGDVIRLGKRFEARLVSGWQD